jgi:hypothetical protein
VHFCRFTRLFSRPLKPAAWDAWTLNLASKVLDLTVLEATVVVLWIATVGVFTYLGLMMLAAITRESTFWLGDLTAAALALTLFIPTRNSM